MESPWGVSCVHRADWHPCGISAAAPLLPDCTITEGVAGIAHPPSPNPQCDATEDTGAEAQPPAREGRFCQRTHCQSRGLGPCHTAPLLTLMSAGSARSTGGGGRGEDRQPLWGRAGQKRKLTRPSVRQGKVSVDSLETAVGAMQPAVG